MKGGTKRALLLLIAILASFVHGEHLELPDAQFVGGIDIESVNEDDKVTDTAVVTIFNS